VILPISEHQLAYGETVKKRLAAAGIRVELDTSNEKLGYKIRHWKTQKVPYLLVVGKSEEADGTVSVNERGIEEKRPPVTVDEIITELQSRIQNKS
jgi:threonyl-tRNA synthetase